MSDPMDRELWVLDSGQIVSNVHPRGSCMGEHCVIHRPSEHHMRDWASHYRQDRAMLERICPHGVGHPDPDHVGDATHGCDGCCAP